MLRKTFTALAAVATLVLQGSPVWAAVPKKKVTTVTKTVTGVTVKCHRWGFVQLALTVKQTITTVGAKKTVTTVKITNVAEPTFPNHTDRSIYINQQALPLLNQEVLQLQLGSAKLEMITGATETSESFIQSLQAALLAAKQA
jgi:uncharacterized protein with FMN-binding domain